MATPIEALKVALYNDGQADNRKTFGTVEYALIPVDVIEAVIDDYYEIKPEQTEVLGNAVEVSVPIACSVPPAFVEGVDVSPEGVDDVGEEPITSFDTEGDSDQGDRDICVVPAVPTAVMGSEEEEE